MSTLKVTVSTQELNSKVLVTSEFFSTESNVPDLIKTESFDSHYAQTGYMEGLEQEVYEIYILDWEISAHQEHDDFSWKMLFTTY